MRPACCELPELGSLPPLAAARLLEVLPPPRSCGADEEGGDVLQGDRPLLAVVPAAEPPPGLGALGLQAHHSVQLYSLRSHGYVHEPLCTLSFSGEVLGMQASERLLVVALRGQLQAFDAATLQHTFSCLTYVPPPPLLRQLSRSGSSGSSRRQQVQQQFVTEGLVSSASSAGSEVSHPQQAGGGGAADAPAAQAPAAPLAPFALGPRWLAYAADTPVPAASGQAVAQRLPLARRDCSSGRASGSLEGEGGGSGAADAARGSTLTRAAVADAALQVHSGPGAAGLLPAPCHACIAAGWPAPCGVCTPAQLCPARRPRPCRCCRPRPRAGSSCALG